MERRAKIVATLGPASARPDVLPRLLEAGVDVVRFNLSHGSREDHRQNLRLLREACAAAGRHVPVFADLMGPRYRLGQLPEGGRVLRAGERVTIGGAIAGSGAGGATGAVGAAPDLPLDDPDLLRHLGPGERILIDNGLVELQVEQREAGAVIARVVTGGPVSTRKGINLPDSQLPFAISAKDASDIRFALEEGIDYLAASYVGSAADVEAVRAVSRGSGRELPIIAKLERLAAVDRIDEIVAAADAVMVARGDLGVEVPLHRVPVLQKRIIAAGRRIGKPVIVATQMLESMVEHPRPTRAETSDVANAVFDGADALMLSGETAVGEYPVEVVKTMARIICEAEEWAETQRRERKAYAGERRGIAAIVPGHTELDVAARGSVDIPEVISAAAAQVAESLAVRRIVAYSQGGFTARLIARHRPSAPILAVTPDAALARRVQLVWGVRPLVLDLTVQHADEVVQVVERHLLDAGLAAKGDTILVLMGDPIRDRPLTNLLRAHRVGR